MEPQALSSRPQSSRIVALQAETLPPELYPMAKACLLDLIGVAAGAGSTPLAHIGREFVLAQYPGDRPLLLAHGTASPTGAALYGGWLIDALDAHDGHVLTKGHAGVALLPALLALPETDALTGQQLLGELAIGYEIAIRAGIALHGSACDYHTSGAWNCLGVVGMAGRLMGLSVQQLEHALGIAEFYGPRSQMMRCIDHPTMLKDGSGWGAMTGMAAVLLARSGFTGAPALLLGGQKNSSAELTSIWQDLGSHWRLPEVYFKRFPVCYWAQPAVEAVLSLRDRLVDCRRIRAIHIVTFHQAKRLHTASPQTTEQAQYSLPWAVASAICRGTIDHQSVTSDLGDQAVHRLAARVHIEENQAFNDAFPGQRLARACIQLDDGTQLTSECFEARGTPDNPLTGNELDSKFRQLTGPVLGKRSEAILEVVHTLDQRPAADLLALLGPAGSPAPSTAH